MIWLPKVIGSALTKVTEQTSVGGKWRTRLITKSTFSIIGLVMTEKQAMDARLSRASVSTMLKSVLGNHCDGLLIQVDDDCFQLVALVPDILCQHEDWNEFVKLVAEYSDDERPLF
jgi:hypothetical protein